MCFVIAILLTKANADDYNVTYITGNYYDEETATYTECIYITGLADKTITDLVIPDTIDDLPVMFISDNAFKDCGRLETIQLPNNLKSIGNYAFYMCSSLTEIIIPDNVTSIGNSAFYLCTSLTNFTLSNNLSTPLCVRIVVSES
jgi:hypothetical protein